VGAPKFSIADGTAKRNALEHLKYAYPGNKNFVKEFVWLEESINAPAKAQVSLSQTSIFSMCLTIVLLLDV
jgi:hypothetical protein